MTSEAAAPVRLEVPANAVGVRLDRFLAEPLGSRAKAQTLIDSERVRVDGRVRPKRHLVGAGEVIEASTRRGRHRRGRRRSTAPFAIAYEDEHLLVVDKPAGVVVHPARGHWTGTLAQALAARGAGGEEPWRAGIVHRLDRDTSGLLVVAKSDEVHRALKARAGGAQAAPRVPGARRRAAAGADRDDRRADRPPPPRAHADVDRHRRRRARRGRTSSSSGCCRTRRCCASCSTPGARTRSACTWRRSAIRCAATPSTGPRGVYGLERQFLHAARLAFAHPVTRRADRRPLAAARRSSPRSRCAAR